MNAAETTAEAPAPGLRCPCVQVSGTWFVGKRPPVWNFADNGVWQVTILAYDKLRPTTPGVPTRLEPWLFLWSGEHAHQWWRAHGARVLAGAALRIHAERIRAHTAADRSAEIRADVVFLEFEERARELAARVPAKLAGVGVGVGLGVGA